MRERGKRACWLTVVNDDDDDDGDGDAEGWGSPSTRCLVHARLAGKKQARTLAREYLMALAQTFLGCI